MMSGRIRVRPEYDVTPTANLAMVSQPFSSHRPILKNRALGAQGFYLEPGTLSLPSDAT